MGPHHSLAQQQAQSAGRLKLIAAEVYQVTVIPGGERFDCESGEYILNAAHAANILISYSCRSGQCGSCMGRLHSGEVVYPKGQPDALDAEHRAAGYALFCSATAVSDLTIELLQPEFPA